MSRLLGLAVLDYSIDLLTNTLMPDYADAEQVSFNDPNIKAKSIKFASAKGHGECQSYPVSPTDASYNVPAVLFVHENRGLNPYVKDVACRLAKAGFLAFAPDGLYPLGGHIVNLLAASIPEDLDVGAPYNCSPAAEELHKNVKGPLMVQLGR